MVEELLEQGPCDLIVGGGVIVRSLRSLVMSRNRRRIASADLITAETAGAAFAHIDLALLIVAQESPALADTVAGDLLIGDRPFEAIFAVRRTWPSQT